LGKKERGPPFKNGKRGKNGGKIWAVKNKFPKRKGKIGKGALSLLFCCQTNTLSLSSSSFFSYFWGKIKEVRPKL